MPRKRAAQQLSSDDDYKINQTLNRNGRFTAEQQIAWLRNSKHWVGLDATKWKGRRVIGAGGNGTVGLWDYTGGDDKMPPSMVIKQADSSAAYGLQWESKLLRHASKTNSVHILKLYKACYLEGGTGAHHKFDPLPFNARSGTYNPRKEIARMYMEYCPGGDLEDYVGRSRGRPIPEEHLWRIFGCLARAFFVLEHGVEHPKMGLDNWRPICHFDMKPSNVLIGNLFEDEWHTRLNAIKLADFGLGVFENPSMPGWIEGTQWRATSGWMSPEQKFPQHRNRYIGTPADIWALGAVMHYLTTFSQAVQGPRGKTYFKFRHLCPSGREVDVISTGHILDRSRCRYSKSLVDAILYCLAYDPAERPTAAWLVRETERVIDIYDDMNEYCWQIEDHDAKNIPPAGEPIQNYDIRNLRPSIIPNAPVSDWQPLNLPLTPDVQDYDLLFKPHTPRPQIPRELQDTIQTQQHAQQARPALQPARKEISKVNFGAHEPHLIRQRKIPQGDSRGPAPIQPPHRQVQFNPNIYVQNLRQNLPPRQVVLGLQQGHPQVHSHHLPAFPPRATRGQLPSTYGLENPLPGQRSQNILLSMAPSPTYQPDRLARSQEFRKQLDILQDAPLEQRTLELPQQPGIIRRMGYFIRSKTPSFMGWQKTSSQQSTQQQRQGQEKELQQVDEQHLQRELIQKYLTERQPSQPPLGGNIKDLLSARTPPYQDVQQTSHHPYNLRSLPTQQQQQQQQQQSYSRKRPPTQLPQPNTNTATREMYLQNHPQPLLPNPNPPGVAPRQHTQNYWEQRRRLVQGGRDNVMMNEYKYNKNWHTDYGYEEGYEEDEITKPPRKRPRI